MSIRHKAVKEALDKGRSSEWNDDHKIDFTDQLTFYDTFIYRPAVFVDSSCWYVLTSGGAGINIGMVDNHLYCNLTSGVNAGANVFIDLGGIEITNKLDLPKATFSIRLSTTKRHEFGFLRHVDTPFTANQRGAYFRVENDVLFAVTGDGTAETPTDLGFPNEYGVYRIEFTSTTVDFYVDDMTTKKASHVNNIPSEDFTIRLTTKTYDTTSQILRTDGVGLERGRKSS